MPVNRDNVKKCLANFDFKNLFIEELFWNHDPESGQTIKIGDEIFQISFIAQHGGFRALICTNPGTGKIPDRNTQIKIDTQIRKIAYEHLIIFVDKKQTQSVWLWVKREKGQSPAIRTHSYTKGQSGDSLAQKLAHIAFELSDLDEEGNVSISTVTKRAKKAFDVEKVTKKFYTEFKSKHEDFLKFIKGIEEMDDRKWYASVMLNRLMFIYFIQKKGFLNGDVDYLNTKLREFKSKKNDKFYSEFLTTLFFDGFAKEEKERDNNTNRMLGTIPFLNGGIFMPHQIEETYGKTLEIADSAFDRLFGFFDQYRWNLDERPTKDDKEINPDVLGYIFEKYINQKQMGAYYTKEDITDYISKNTIIPFLFDKQRPKDLEPFPMADVDRYIYDAVKKGVELELPDYIECGIKSVPDRTRWNEPADEEYALPTEIWREVVARRQRYDQIHEDFRTGKISIINDLITYNLDITKFAQDWVAQIEEPSALNYFYFENLTKISVLDPTCGSGAFLFAALNILESLYEICLDRMEEFTDPKHPKFKHDYAKNFERELKRIEKHPNRKYFVYKEIIIRNLFGVDIMDEAVEICKLRLFLKLVAQVDKVEHIEPLPDIDFNIRAGNTLIGYTSLDDINKAKVETMDFGIDVLGKVKEAARAVRDFRSVQMESGASAREFAVYKEEVKAKFKIANDALDRDLAQISYQIDISNEKKFAKWKKSHKPFHWYVDFYEIMESGGFGVIIGNPPYVEYSVVKKDFEINDYKTIDCGNIYANILERCINITSNVGRVGMIVQLPIVCTDRMIPLQELYKEKNQAIWFSTFDDRPARLFDGLEHIRATIAISKKGNNPEIYLTKYNRWYSESRDVLFPSIYYVDEGSWFFSGAYPKTGMKIEWDILQKLNKYPKLVSEISGSKSVYYHNSPQYWIRSMTFKPYFWNERDGEKLSQQVKEITLNDFNYAKTASSMLNSNLFYWWFIILSDCRHLNRREIDNFPTGIKLMNEDSLGGLVKINEKLMIDYKKNAFRKECEYKTTGKVIYDEFYPSKSKHIIDEIDRVLAKHYGFTDEELDFIINYDIKYRMGIRSGKSGAEVEESEENNE